ncbi:FAD-dependent monooxygenase [Sansalvadorimonas sp. 2012CJ34-2]|uniref:FAD-dependent monooxygenase n=1 Tax=Parendozoicomonas callyspongiae TaxID=2942213 RepID=A0ABT0PBM8_9GAMM|nr:FAD-dependent monooxygenase [Sansalvadorimonas sp. 2012CJ34-2]
MGQYDVVIAGAGMVGAAIGCALGQAGMKVALVDPVQPEAFNPESVPDLRVSALSPASEAFLHKLGAWNHIRSMRLCPYRRMAVWEKLKEPLSTRTVSSRFNQTMFDCTEVDTDRLGYIVENRVTQLALHSVMETCSNIELFCPASPRKLSLNQSLPTLSLDNGEEVKGKLIIGADGANSFIRREAGIGLSSEDYEQRALVATVEIPTGPLDITWQAFTATGPLALLPLPNIGHKSYASLVWYNQPEAVADLMEKTDEQFLEAVRKQYPEELPEMLKLNERGWFKLTRRHASTYIKKGVALVGDAAHTINPLAGQGVKLGFQDAECLTDLLINAWENGHDISDKSILENYELKRRPENRKMQLVMDGFYHLFSNENAPLKFVRNIGLTVAGHFPYGRKKVMRYAMGLEEAPRWPLG